MKTVELRTPAGLPGDLFLEMALPALMPEILAALVGAGDPAAWRARGWQSQAEFEVALRRSLCNNTNTNDAGAADGSGERAVLARGLSEEAAATLAGRLEASMEVHVHDDDDEATTRTT